MNKRRYHRYGKSWRYFSNFLPSAKANLFRFLAAHPEGGNTFFSWRGTLYHGSPTDGLIEMSQTGIEPRPHGEIPGSWFCASPNEYVLGFYGDTSSGTHNGICFGPVVLENCLALHQIHLDVLTYIKIGSDGSDKFAYELCENKRLLRLLMGREYQGIYSYPESVLDYLKSISACGEEWIFENLPSDFHGFIYPDCHKQLASAQDAKKKVWYDWHGDYFRNDAELALSSASCKILERALKSNDDARLYLQSEEFDSTELTKRWDTWANNVVSADFDLMPMRMSA